MLQKLYPSQNHSFNVKDYMKLEKFFAILTKWFIIPFKIIHEMYARNCYTLKIDRVAQGCQNHLNNDSRKIVLSHNVVHILSFVSPFGFSWVISVGNTESVCREREIVNACVSCIVETSGFSQNMLTNCVFIHILCSVQFTHRACVEIKWIVSALPCERVYIYCCVCV